MQNRKLKHKKIKNTGLLYEFLIRQVTGDVLKGAPPTSLNLIKKFFGEKSPLKEELELYTILLGQKVKDSNFAFKIIETVLNTRDHIDKEKLKRDKYNLLKEINQKYDSELFFKTKVPNYPVYASIYTLLEYSEKDSIQEYLDHKLNVANFLLESKISETSSKAFTTPVPSELRGLTFKLMTEKFNEKWNTLSHSQKNILRHFIHNPVDSKDSLSFIKERFDEVERELTNHINSIDDKVLKIKLTETLQVIPSLFKGNFTAESHYLSLMRYYELLNELRNF